MKGWEEGYGLGHPLLVGVQGFWLAPWSCAQTGWLGRCAHFTACFRILSIKSRVSLI